MTRDEVINVALTRLTGSNARTENRLRGLTVSAKCDSAENALLYEVATDCVSLLLSGSKACYPILGKYTTHHGPLLNRYDSLPGGLRTFLDGYVQQIAFCFERDTIGLYYQDVWDSLIGGISLVRRDRNSIGPLMSTWWDQKYCNGSVDIGYEYDMPSGDTCEHCVAGCVAVAISQEGTGGSDQLPAAAGFQFSILNSQLIKEGDMREAYRVCWMKKIEKNVRCEKKVVSLQTDLNKQYSNNNLKNKQLCLQELDYSVMVKRTNPSTISLLRMVVHLGTEDLSRN